MEILSPHGQVSAATVESLVWLDVHGIFLTIGIYGLWRGGAVLPWLLVADFEEAFLKALIAVGFRLPIRRALLSTGPIETKAAFLESARTLRDMDVTLYATMGTAAFLRTNGIEAVPLHWPTETASPNMLEYLSQRKMDLVINIPKDTGERELTNDYLIRRRAADFGIPLITNIQLAQRFVEALSKIRMCRSRAGRNTAHPSASRKGCHGFRSRKLVQTGGMVG